MTTALMGGLVLFLFIGAAALFIAKKAKISRTTSMLGLPLIIWLILYLLKKINIELPLAKYANMPSVFSIPVFWNIILFLISLAVFSYFYTLTLEKKNVILGNYIFSVILITTLLTLMFGTGLFKIFLLLALAIACIEGKIHKHESRINPAITLVLAAMLIDFTSLFSFGTGILTSLGLGLVVGIILMRILKQYYHKILSPLIVLIALCITHFAAPQLEASSIISVATIGFMYSRSRIKNKNNLDQYLSKIFNLTLPYLVLVLAILVYPPGGIHFYVFAALLFIISVRWKPQRKLRDALISPRGIAMASVLLLLLLNYNQEYILFISIVGYLVLLLSVIISDFTQKI
ncbi:MAG: hypothetical protein KKG59_02760 [Nanoarchaeota archaeon]|nr:hypothetical protein [Nanoarchaeota archaeon]